jgi:hypothetical protein
MMADTAYKATYVRVVVVLRLSSHDLALVRATPHRASLGSMIIHFKLMTVLAEETCPVWFLMETEIVYVPAFA